MQKFTLFSLVLSVSMILIIGDIVLHGYLSNGGEEPLPVIEENLPVQTPDTTEAVDNTQTVLENNLGIDTESDASVQLQEETGPLIATDLFSLAGFLNPVLKETTFSGLVFQFIPFSDQDQANVLQWNLFDGENYVGSIYEIKYATDTAGFQGYLTLRDSAKTLYELGETNEINNYGDASFYFNHKTKIKTIHLVMRSGKDIFAFEYSDAYHEQMKKVFDIL